MQFRPPAAAATAEALVLLPEAEELPVMSVLLFEVTLLQAAEAEVLPADVFELFEVSPLQFAAAIACKYLPVAYLV